MTRQYKPDYIEKALYASLSAMTATPIVFAGQQHHELTPPYVSLSVDSRRAQGTDEPFTLLNDGTEVYHGQRNGGITLIFVGDDCTALADDLINALKRPEAARLARLNGPVLYGAQPINIGPIQTEGAQAQQACAVDLQYRIAVVHAELGGIIDAVTVQYKIIRADNRQFYEGAMAEYLDDEKPPAGTPVKAVVFVQQELTVGVGQMIPQPHFLTLPRDWSGVQSFTWQSADDAIATPDSSTSAYMIRGVSVGETVISLFVNNKDGTHAKADITITVTD